MGNERKTNLYHCTKSDSLVKILESKHFRYSYCLEEYYMHQQNLYTLEKLAYAMVCFADLLKEEVYGHMEQFGADSYIVMDKKWAVKNNLSPVIYYSKGGLPNYAYLSLTKNIKDLLDNGSIQEIIVANAIELLRPYFKLYEGHYFINGKDEPSKNIVEFFLEREWRSIPFVTGGERFYLDLQDYLNENIKNKAKQELLDHGYCLGFEWKDILKIGCKKEKKNDIFRVAQESFGIGETDALMKIEVIQTIDIKQ